MKTSLMKRLGGAWAAVRGRRRRAPAEDGSDVGSLDTFCAYHPRDPVCAP